MSYGWAKDAEALVPPPCPRCGEPMFKIPVWMDGDAWVWGHDCEPGGTPAVRDPSDDPTSTV